MMLIKTLFIIIQKKLWYLWNKMLKVNKITKMKLNKINFKMIFN